MFLFSNLFLLSAATVARSMMHGATGLKMGLLAEDCMGMTAVASLMKSNHVNTMFQVLCILIVVQSIILFRQRACQLWFKL